MTLNRTNPRNPEAEVDCIFTDRWSPRAFASTTLSDCQINSMFEAARWSPSCYNEQPWLFLYAVGKKDRQRFASALVPQNQVWASTAPMLIYLLCRRDFSQTGKVNRHSAFDAGAAWMALALQARRLGLYAHAMAGFSRKKASDLLSVPEEQYDIMAAIAVGYRTDPQELPDNLAEQERPGQRKPRKEVAREGSF